MKISDIHEEIQKLGTSKPVFKIKEAADGNYVDFVVKDKYEPEPAKTVIEYMVRSSFSERFNKHDHKFVVETKPDTVYRKASEAIMNIYTQGCPLKNPRLGATHKYLRRNIHNIHSPFASGILSLFSYALENCIRDENKTVDITNIRFEGGINNIHLKNIVAILEKIREKYE